MKRRFEVYLVDEANTSKINYKTHEEQEHLKIKVKFEEDGIMVEKEKEMYSVLTFQMGNWKGCINRDYNATKNILRVVESELEGKGRPEDLMTSKKKAIHPIRRGKVCKPKDEKNVFVE